MEITTKLRALIAVGMTGLLLLSLATALEGRSSPKSHPVKGVMHSTSRP